MMEQERPTIIDIVIYALEMSVNGVTYVLVVHFKSKNTFKVCKLAGLTVDIHDVFTKNV